MNRWREHRRQHRCQSQLPQVCYLLAGAVRAGLSLEDALRVVAEEGPSPIRHEFARVISAQALGTTFDAALTPLATRIGGDDVAMLCFALRLVHETGGNIAATLHALAGRMYESDRVRSRIRALTMQGSISAVVIAALPLCTVTLMFWIFPAMVLPLVTTPLGWGCVGVALLLDGLGLWWLRRLVRISI